MSNGYGGVWLDPAPGLPDDKYLSEEWYAVLNSVARRIRKRRGSIWLHEPYSAARVESLQSRLIKSPAARLHWLRPAIVRTNEVDFDHCEAAFLLSADSNFPETPPDRPALRRSDVRERLTPQSSARPTDWAIVLLREVAPATPSPLRAEIAAALFEHTFSRTQTAAKRYFGNTIGLSLLGPLEMPIPENAIPWDPDIVSLHAEAFDEDLIAQLPDLFLDGADSARVRHDFRALVAGMARESTGLALQRAFNAVKMPWAMTVARRPASAEHPRPLQAMSLMAFQDFPAVEVDARHINVGDALRLKEAVSINHQLRKHGVLCITSERDNLPFDPIAMRRHTNTCLALGATYLAHTGPSTVMAGDRPAELFAIDPRQPAWPLLQPQLASHARASWILSQGHHECEVLLIRPAIPVPGAPLTTWPGDSDPETAFFRQFHGIAETLLEHQIDFDLADERLLGDLGRAVRKRLSMGEHLYSIVVIPPCDSLRASTYRLLQDFATGGGRVLFVGSAPRMMDGRIAAEWQGFLENYAVRVCDGPAFGDFSGVVEPLIQWNARRLNLRDVGENGSLRGLRIQTRRWEESDVVFIANSGHRVAAATWTYRPSAAGTLERWDIETGEQVRIAPLTPDEAVEIDVRLESGEAALWISLSDPREIEESPEMRESRKVPCEWHGRRDRPVMIRMEPVTSPDESASRTTVQFVWEGPPADSPLSLMVLSQNKIDVTLNEEPLRPVATREEWQNDVHTLDLGHVEAGTHSLEWTTPDAPPAAVFLAGDIKEIGFDAQGVPRVSHAPNRVRMGHWNEHGLDRFPGAVVYAAEVQGYELYDGDRVVLEAPGLRGCASVRINRELAGHLLTPPYTLDITDKWKAAQLTIELEMPGDLRSALQPDFSIDNALLTPPRIRILTPDRSPSEPASE